MVINNDGKLKFVRGVWSYVESDSNLINFIKCKIDYYQPYLDKVKKEADEMFPMVFTKKTYSETEFKNLVFEHIIFGRIRHNRFNDVYFELYGYFVFPHLVKYLTKKGITIIKEKTPKN